MQRTSLLPRVRPRLHLRPPLLLSSRPRPRSRPPPRLRPSWGSGALLGASSSAQRRHAAPQQRRPPRVEGPPVLLPLLRALCARSPPPKQQQLQGRQRHACRLGHEAWGRAAVAPVPRPQVQQWPRARSRQQVRPRPPCRRRCPRRQPPRAPPSCAACTPAGAAGRRTRRTTWWLLASTEICTRHVDRHRPGGVSRVVVMCVGGGSKHAQAMAIRQAHGRMLPRMWREVQWSLTTAARLPTSPPPV